jgi:mannose-6-phosphate isomerase-like protein (cupin superfamily)
MTSFNPPVAVGQNLHLAARGKERSAWYSGWFLTFLATGEETSGQYSLTEVTGRRNHSVIPPLHIHTREEECFYVVDGAITCYVGDEVIHVPAGAFIVLPTLCVSWRPRPTMESRSSGRLQVRPTLLHYASITLCCFAAARGLPGGFWPPAVALLRPRHPSRSADEITTGASEFGLAGRSTFPAITSSGHRS